MNEYPVPDIYEGEEAAVMRRHYFNVGRVAVELANLEDTLAWLVWQIGSASKGQENIAMLRSSSVKLQQRLKHHADAGGESSAELAGLLDRYLYFRAQRNIAAHSSVVTAFGEEPHDQELAMDHPKSNQFYRLPSTNEVNGLLVEITEVRRAAYRLTNRVIDSRRKARA